MFEWRKFWILALGLFAVHALLSMWSFLVFARHTNGVPHLSEAESLVLALSGWLWRPVVVAGRAGLLGWMPGPPTGDFLPIILNSAVQASVAAAAIVLAWQWFAPRSGGCPDLPAEDRV